MNRPDAPVAVVGAGLAGLSCAVALQARGLDVRLTKPAMAPAAA